jgi:hypothetical protein
MNAMEDAWIRAGRKLKREHDQKVDDPHRLAGCNWDGTVPEKGEPPSWFSDLDWAVYHAPGWEHWQAFRASLVGTPIPERLDQIWMWVHSHPTNLAETIRVVNLLRSLRGMDSKFPQIAQDRAEMNRRLSMLR